MMRHYILVLFLVLGNCRAEPGILAEKSVHPGAEQFNQYLPLLKGKNVGIVANQTSLTGRTHLVDTLLSKDIHIVKIFAPEHGFRGTAGAGDKINDSVDYKTGIPLISLYGSSFKPSPKSLEGIDIMVYDIQDVGVRFYTYISTMHYVMEACAEKGIPLVILDRPNPLGHYTDGPVLHPEYSSFVGMHPIPVVYGMTCGELGLMINAEGWLKNGARCDLKVIPCSNYDHLTYYFLPVNPSPNLNSMESVYLYPSVCFFEGTIMSLGRGTEYPFRMIGHPEYPDTSFSFIPRSNAANRDPLFNNKICYGIDLRFLTSDTLKKAGIDPGWLIQAFKSMNKGEKFFTDYFDKLAGTDMFRKQIIEGKSGPEIRESWSKDLVEFKKLRKKYLLYKDFE